VEPFGDHRSVLLAAYDEQLRGVAEMQGVQSWDRDGPLYRALWERGGFVSYESLAGVEDLDDLIERTVAYFAGIAQVEEFEWKSRGHDHPADLDTRLQAAGLVPEEVETVMVGEAATLAVEVELPPEVVIRPAGSVPQDPPGADSRWPPYTARPSPRCRGGVDPPLGLTLVPTPRTQSAEPCGCTKYNAQPPHRANRRTLRYRGTTVTAQRSPGARPSLTSAVSSAQSSDSANATYEASYAERLSRSFQTRSNRWKTA